VEAEGTPEEVGGEVDRTPQPEDVGGFGSCDRLHRLDERPAMEHEPGVSSDPDLEDAAFCRVR